MIGDGLSALIVEDEPLVAQDLAAHMRSLGFSIVGIAHNGVAALDLLANRLPDFVILDIHLGGGDDGIDIAKVIKHKYDLPFVFITSYADEDTLDRAKETMPIGYIIKPFDETDLKSTLEIGLYRFDRASKKGLKPLPILNELSGNNLSAREYHILEGLILGLTNQQLAEKHYVSENTIKTHLKRIYAKFGAHSRTEMTKILLSY